MASSTSKAFHTYENVGYSEQIGRQRFNRDATSNTIIEASSQSGPQPCHQHQSTGSQINPSTAIASVATNNGNGNSHTTTMQLSANKTTAITESPFPDPNKQHGKSTITKLQ